LKADVSSVSPSSEQINELWVVLGFYGEWWNYAIGKNMEDSSFSGCRVPNNSVAPPLST